MNTHAHPHTHTVYTHVNTRLLPASSFKWRAGFVPAEEKKKEGLLSPGSCLASVLVLKLSARRQTPVAAPVAVLPLCPSPGCRVPSRRRQGQLCRSGCRAQRRQTAAAAVLPPFNSLKFPFLLLFHLPPPVCIMVAGLATTTTTKKTLLRQITPTHDLINWRKLEMKS